MNLVIFYVWKNLRAWASLKCSFDMHLNHLGPTPSLTPSCVLPKVHPSAVAAIAGGLMATTFFVH